MLCSWMIALLASTPTALSAALPASGFASDMLAAVQAEMASMNISQVRAQAISASTRSWELGTLAEALLELEWPSLSIFGDRALPPPRFSPKNTTAADVFSIVQTTLSTKPAKSLALIAGDGAVGDPASIGPAVLLANWTLTNATYGEAAQGQLEYLLTGAPRAPSGAISHRSDQVQLWADFTYVAIPFIAYYGALQVNKTLLQEAYDQCRLYRGALFDADVSLWRHIALGSWQDTNHWATGNGWAAAGMMRVLQTINSSSIASTMQEQQDDLLSWVDEILTGAWKYQQPNGGLMNYLDQKAPATFPDTSSTALLAATSFRFAAFTNSTAHISAAEKAYDLVQRSVGGNGALSGTVDPITFNTASAAGSVSPEGQSFVLLLQAARDAWTLSSA